MFLQEEGEVVLVKDKRACELNQLV